MVITDTHTIDIARYSPAEYECERASNSYLMSVVAIMVGAPLPIVNLLATFFFYMANRKSTPFVRWHCTQALLSQITIFIINAISITWTLRIIFTDLVVTDLYVGYVITVILFNLFEFIITVVAAIKVRKGKHVEWIFWGTITNGILGNTVTNK